MDQFKTLIEAHYPWFFVSFVLAVTILERYFGLTKNPIDLRKVPQLIFWVWFSEFFLNDHLPVVQHSLFTSLRLYTLGDFFESTAGAFLLQCPAWGRVAVYFLLRELAAYGLHWSMHNVRCLWEIHKVHHNLREMRWTGSYRFHFLEELIWVSITYFIARCTSVPPLAVWGLEFFQMAYGTLQHANLRLTLGPLEHVLNSTRAHWWHHSDDCHYRGGQNFGAMTSIFDHLFGTYYYPPSLPRIGFVGIESYPDTITGQLLSPFILAFSSGRTKFASWAMSALRRIPI